MTMSHTDLGLSFSLHLRSTALRMFWLVWCLPLPCTTLHSNWLGARLVHACMCAAFRLRTLGLICICDCQADTPKRNYICLYDRHARNVHTHLRLGKRTIATLAHGHNRKMPFACTPGSVFVFQVTNNCTCCFFKTRGPFFKQCKHTTLSTAMTFCHQPGMLPARGSHAVIVLLCEVHLCGYTHCKKRLEPIQVSDHHGERRRPDPRPRQEHDCSAGADVIGVSCISCLLEARDMDALHHEHNRSARLLSRTQLHPNA